MEFAEVINKSHLQILDLSWNNLGLHNPCIELLFEKLKDNDKLY